MGEDPAQFSLSLHESFLGWEDDTEVITSMSMVCRFTTQLEFPARPLLTCQVAGSQNDLRPKSAAAAREPMAAEQAGPSLPPACPDQALAATRATSSGW